MVGTPDDPDPSQTSRQAADSPASPGEASLSALFSDQTLRSRLLAALEHQLGSRLTLVVAPAGSGKSTLLRTWRDRTRQGIAWCSLTEREAQLDGFLPGLVGAVQQRYPGFDREVLDVLRPREVPPVRLIVRELVRGLAALPDPLVIVLDNYHCVDDPAVQAIMVKLLEQLPEHVRLVLATRTVPPLRLGLFRARGQLLELRGT